MGWLGKATVTKLCCTFNVGNIELGQGTRLTGLDRNSDVLVIVMNQDIQQLAKLNDDAICLCQCFKYL